MPVRTLPQVGDVRYDITWIDRDAMRKSDGQDEDLGDRLEAAERRRTFVAEAVAKAWAVSSANQDEYGAPRFEKRIFDREYDECEPEWLRSDDYQEFVDGAWISVFE